MRQTAGCGRRSAHPTARNRLIPFNKPVWLGTELSRIQEAVVANGHLAGGGPFGARCEAELERLLGVRTLLVSSCTHALEMSALLLDIAPGDEVIVPSFTFVSTANAFALRGARIVFADVDRDGNIAPDEVARLRTARTRAVAVVHYAGNSCDMHALLDASAGVPVVEDAAQAIGASFDGRPLGTFGACAALSFHETKNIGCGEGGALMLGAPGLVERAEYIRDKGTNRRRFQAGLVDKYTWVDIGSSYVLSDLNAAYLIDQLTSLERIHARRSAVFRAYHDALAGPVEAKGGHLIRSGGRNVPNHHLFAIVFAEPAQRTAFIEHMREHRIVAPFHYVALHLSPMGRKHHGGNPLPGSERLSGCLVRLPLYFNITDAEVAEVIDRTVEFVNAL